MANKDLAIRERMAEELFKLPYKNVDIAALIDCESSTITKWQSRRYLPDMYHLAGLYEIGVDVIYVLTGERTR